MFVKNFSSNKRRRSYDRDSRRKKSIANDEKSSKFNDEKSSRNNDEKISKIDEQPSKPIDRRREQKSPKIEMNEKDIEDLQRRVNEAKRVLEIIVKEKEEELQKEKEKEKQSITPDRKKHRRSKRYSDSSD